MACKYVSCLKLWCYILLKKKYKFSEFVAAQADVTSLQAKWDANFGNAEHAVQEAIEKVQIIQGII